MIYHSLTTSKMIQQHLMQNQICTFRQATSQCEAMTNIMVGLCHRLEDMFSDYQINHNCWLRHLILDNPKGYVSINDLLLDPVVEGILKEAKVIGGKRQAATLRRAVLNHSMKLRANCSQIRRLLPYEAKYKAMQPIYLDGLPENINVVDLTRILNLKHPIQRIAIKYKLYIPYALVYYQQPDQIFNKEIQLISEYGIQLLAYSKFKQFCEQSSSLQKFNIDPVICHQRVYPEYGGLDQRLNSTGFKKEKKNIFNFDNSLLLYP